MATSKQGLFMDEEHAHGAPQSEKGLGAFKQIFPD
jgi:hypothetical protein